MDLRFLGALFAKVEGVGRGVRGFPKGLKQAQAFGVLVTRAI